MTGDPIETLREHLPVDYLGPDRNDPDGEKWGQHPDGCKRRPAGVTGWDHIDNAEQMLTDRVDELERGIDLLLEWATPRRSINLYVDSMARSLESLRNQSAENPGGKP